MLMRMVYSILAYVMVDVCMDTLSLDPILCKSPVVRLKSDECVLYLDSGVSLLIPSNGTLCDGIFNNVKVQGLSSYCGYGWILICICIVLITVGIPLYILLIVTTMVCRSVDDGKWIGYG